MSSPVSVLRLERRPSRRLTLLMGAVHVIALLVVVPLPVPWWIKPPLMALIVIQWMAVWRHHLAMTAPAAVRSLIWNADGRWELILGDGSSSEARLLPAAYVHPWLVVLRFVSEDKRRSSVVLPADGLPADEHRRLRVRLGLAEAHDRAASQPRA